MTKRAFRAADISLRCRAVVTLRDGTTASCMRYGIQDYARNPAVNDLLCEQHAAMKLAGRDVYAAKKGRKATSHEQ